VPSATIASGVGLHGHPAMSKFPMTATGHSALVEELRRRTQLERVRIIQRIQDAIANEPDLAENSEYQSAKSEQEINEVRIAELEK
jgi:transcription elongation factor GreA